MVQVDAVQEPDGKWEYRALLKSRDQTSAINIEDFSLPKFDTEQQAIEAGIKKAECILDRSKLKRH